MATQDDGRSAALSPDAPGHLEESLAVSVDRALVIAINHHRAGRLTQARAVYEAILAARPDHFDALHLLGVAARQDRELERSAELLRRAAELKPDFGLVHFNLGRTLRSLGRSDDAMVAFERAADLDPAHADAHVNLGAILAEQNRLAEAVARLERAAALRPGHAQTHLLLAMVRQAMGRLDGAADAYEVVLALGMASASTRLALAAIRLAQNRYDDALRQYQAALALDPNQPEALDGIGRVLQACGRPRDAIEHLKRAVDLAPDFVEAHVNLGLALEASGSLDEAAAAYRRAIALRPELPEPYNNLAGVLREQRKLDESIATYRRALQLDPGHARIHSNLIFALDVDERTSVAESQAERGRWYAAHRMSDADRFRDWPNDPDAERRLRVGYVSADFRRHSAAYTFAPVVLGHDRQRFEVYAYSSTRLEDDLTARFRSAVDHWRSVSALTDEQLARMVRDDAIDLLVDLSGHTAGNRLRMFTAKPAPVQLSIWGITGTGVAEIDYQLSGPIIVPPAERHLFAEQIFDMPCAFVYQAPSDAPDLAPLPASTGGPFTFGCLNRFGKVSDRVLSLWARILRERPDSRLLLKDRSFSDDANRRAVLQRLARAGIPSDRVVLLGSTTVRGHMEAYRSVDLALDTFPQNGGVTTLEALWMGVPVVTRVGDLPHGRVAASILTALGLGRFVAASDDDYVATALERAADLNDLSTLRASIRVQLGESPIANPAVLVATVESAYRTMWRRWCATRDGAATPRIRVRT